MDKRPPADPQPLPGRAPSAEGDGLEPLRDTLLGLVRDPAQRDLTLRQLGILLLLCSTPGPHTVRGIAADLGILKAAVTRALDVLEEAGLARRTPDPGDRRSIRAVPTPAGETLAQRLSAMLQPG